MTYSIRKTNKFNCVVLSICSSRNGLHFHKAFINILLVLVRSTNALRVNEYAAGEQHIHTNTQALNDEMIGYTVMRLSISTKMIMLLVFRWPELDNFR